MGQSEAAQNVPKHVLEELTKHGLALGDDGKLIWGDDAPTHPKNWPVRRKVYDTALITLFVTISAMIGNVGTSVARAAASDLAISSICANIAFASTFFYGQAVGGLVLPPFTESFGRKRTNIVATAGYAVACILVGVPQRLAAVVVGRFVSGFLSALPTVVGAGSVEDMWDVRARIWAIDIWVKGSIVGIALGPFMSTYISTSSLRWPWVFHSAAIMLAITCLLCIGTHESRPSILLKRHCRTVQKATGYDDLDYENNDNVPDFRTFARTMLIRPIRFFFTEPIITAVSIMSGTIFASIYLQTEGLTVPYQDFGYSERSISLVYLAWAVGLVLTVPLRLNDWRIISNRIRFKQNISPEDKITGFYCAAPVLAGALWWFSWSIPPKVSHVSPFISIASLVLVGAATNEFDGILQGYLTDSYAAYAASANAPLAFLRAMLSGSFPIFAKQMFTGLGSNVAASILAGLATVFCFVATWFWRYGDQIRESSRFAIKIERSEGPKEDDGLGRSTT